MKKNIIVGVVIAILVISIIVEGVFIFLQIKKNKEVKNEDEKQNIQVEKQKPEVVPSPETIDGESLEITKEYNNHSDEDVVYTYLNALVTEKTGSKYEYKYEVPQINIKSEDVEKINKSILDKCEESLKKSNEEQIIDFDYEGLEYQYYENGDIVSLVMIIQQEGWHYYDIYNINTKTGKQISNEEIAEIKKIKITDNIIKTINELELYKQDYGANISLNYIEKQKQKTIEKYTNEEIKNVDMFINDKNNLCAKLQVYAIAGADIQQVLIDLEENVLIEM